MEVGRTGQQIKVLAAKVDDPCLISGTHMVEREPPLTSTHVPRHVHSQTQNKAQFNKK